MMLESRGKLGTVQKLNDVPGLFGFKSVGKCCTLEVKGEE